ncbi:MAG: prepilin-type N-terminal cleavage/methylation domain-containing protein [Thermoanaerobaculia bacterium]
MTATPDGRLARRSRRERGFTLLELIIVVAIIGVLASIAMPALKDMPRRAQEAVLRANLHTLRDVIDQYYGDKGHYPTTIGALADEGYLRQIPGDPITKSNTTWVAVFEEEDAEEAPPETDQPEGGEPGIMDIHSGSPLVGLNGVPYAEW